MNCWGTLGAVFAFLAVVSGTFAAHGLGDRFERLYGDQPDKMIAGAPVPAAHKYLDDFKTGASYQFLHALGVLLVGAYSERKSSGLLNAAGWCFTLGILFFSGSLYLLTLLAIPQFGMVAPIGGLSFLAGWGLLSFALAKERSETKATRDNESLE